MFRRLVALLEQKRLLPRKSRVTALVSLCMLCLMLSVSGLLPWTERETASADPGSGIVDLTVLLSSDYPCWWAGLAEYQTIPYREIGPDPWRSNVTIIDEHTGTHFDAPPHWIPPAASGLPHATSFGDLTAEKVPVWLFAGEACVIDVHAILDKSANGASPIITTDMVKNWETNHRKLAAGDVVLFMSGYDDKYYVPLPEGRRLLAEPLEGTAPAFPGPDAACIEYLVGKGIRTIGIDSPSMGPFPGAAETHWAGLGAGAIYVEQLVNLDTLPDTGSFFFFLPLKLEGGSGAPGRAAAITDPAKAAELIAAVKAHAIVDLTVTLGPQYPCAWPGAGQGNYSYLYVVAPFNDWTNQAAPYFTRVNIFDAHTGTHFDPPTHFLPGPEFDNDDYSDFVKEVLADYESKYGKRGTSEVYAADVPVEEMMGPARVIDVTHLNGSTPASSWPASPVITTDDIKAYEKVYGAIEAGDVVLFKSNWADRWFAKAPYNTAVADALNGKIEGWASPDPAALIYLAGKGVKCVGTDGASLGAVTGKEAIQTHWAGLTKGMNYVEYLTGLGQLPPEGAFFAFLPIKEEGVRGGNGRAIAVIP
ncbi:MAG: cyclase family protein [Dehalococcoidia bacterium]|jgi:kynurenine formamidase|nr:cyclase family protein [Dehalococcoidia bacterium]